MNMDSEKLNQDRPPEEPEMPERAQSPELPQTPKTPETAQDRLTRRISVVIAALFVAVLTVCGVLVFAIPSKSYSENENRDLAQFPVPNGESLLSGEWQEKLADFLTDQFPARDLFTASASAVTRLVGIRDVGGAYIGKDGYYFEMTTEQKFERARYQNNLLRIEKFAETYPSLPHGLYGKNAR